MNFFQTINFTFKTSLDKDTCYNNLLKNIYQTPRFNGKIKKYEFKISREILGRNSFLPIIIGEIQPLSNEDSENKLKMRINYFVKAFSIVWFTGFIVGSFAVSIVTLGSGKFFPPVYLISLVPIGMFFLFNYLFKKEVKLAKEILMQILEAKEI